jgi:hypothetical protein
MTSDLEKRVKALEDIEEIKKLHTNYILLLNEQRFDEMVDCFADDAKIEGLTHDGKVQSGRQAISELMLGMQKRMRDIKYWKGGQFIVHPMITVDGDKATGSWTWYRIGMQSKFTSELGREIMVDEPREDRYDMEYKRINGKWKMSHMKFTHPWPKQWPK